MTDEDFPFEARQEEGLGEDNLMDNLASRIDKLERDIAFIKARIEDQVELMKQFINRFKGE